MDLVNYEHRKRQIPSHPQTNKTQKITGLAFCTIKMTFDAMHAFVEHTTIWRAHTQSSKQQPGRTGQKTMHEPSNRPD